MEHSSSVMPVTFSLKALNRKITHVCPQLSDFKNPHHYVFQTGGEGEVWKFQLI